jgi:hypothetical protein
VLPQQADPEYVELVWEELIKSPEGVGGRGAIDSLGLNDQELKAIGKVSQSPHQAYLDDSRSFESPRMDVVADIMHHILDRGNTTLTRMHFHTLAYHIIAEKRPHWRYGKEAVAWGSLATSQRVGAVASLSPALDCCRLQAAGCRLQVAGCRLWVGAATVNRSLQARCSHCGWCHRPHLWLVASLVCVTSGIVPVEVVVRV